MTGNTSTSEFWHIASNDGLTVVLYCGDGSALLAFDLDEQKVDNLAGFAVRRTAPDGKSEYLGNLLSFDKPVTAITTPEQQHFTPSDQAPFQKFLWFDFPTPVLAGAYTYDVTAKYFGASGGLTDGPTATVSAELAPGKFPHFELGFTRGYLQSQGYMRHFADDPSIEPEQKSAGFDTAPYQKKWQWLGGHGRDMIFGFINECLADPTITVDMFAYDIDEPDFITAVEKLGPRLRAFLDDSSTHVKPDREGNSPVEVAVHTCLQASAGAANVRQGHFERLAHNKVLIQKKNGTPVKVLTGSANFSIRGLYVQANNVMIFDDSKTAGLYEQAFQQAFTAERAFRSSQIAHDWFQPGTDGVPQFGVCFSPHTGPDVSLQPVASAIDGAHSSVMFAVMDLSGGGKVMDALKGLSSRDTIFGYGVTDDASGASIYAPSSPDGLVVKATALAGNVPAPFFKEWSGGEGHIIHHKFVVVDFNGLNPVVFCGSSNLAAGGETDNGDNLLAIADRSIAVAFAVEAVRLVEHYAFRAHKSNAGPDNPMILQGAGKTPAWWKACYDPSDRKCREREVLVKPVQPSA